MTFATVDEVASASAAAQCHYHAGRFSHAVVEFERCQHRWDEQCHKPTNNKTDHHDQERDEIILADDPTPVKMSSEIRRRRVGSYKPPSCCCRVELVALPPLARSADIAMCRFRSAMISSSVSVGKKSDERQKKTSKSEGAGADNHTSNEILSVSALWKEALETNNNYCRALRGAAISLARTCNNEMHHMKQQQMTKQQKSIQRAMKSTSLAILMAGIASSHLHLHQITSNDYDISKKGDAWNVLVDGAVLAADLMRIRKELMGRTNDNANSDVGRRSDANKSSLLEESLSILNETLCNNDKSNSRRGTHRIEDERGNVAMHSFRTALKVAALATGRLILPKVSTSSTLSSKSELHENKRQKVKLEDDDESTSKNRDAWNLPYLHSSPLLHSRDHLVDALSFHSASVRYPKGREIFMKNREICFERAVEWECRAGTLYDSNNVAETDGCAGYVWKVVNCLRGMEIATTVHARNHGAILQYLEVLASSSSSQFACDLLGCIHALRGDYSLAISKFQSSLDHEGRGNVLRADEEIDSGLAERRTIANMALCFLSLGEVNAPLELLLHAWTTLSESRPCASIAVRPMALLLSPGSYEIDSTSKSPQGVQLDAKMQLIWKVFHAASLAQDWGTCLNATEEMVRGRHETYFDVARAFALLQCQRSSAAKKLRRQLTSSKLDSNALESRWPGLLRVVAELYHADAVLLSEESGSHDEDATIPLNCTQRAIEALDVALRKEEEDGNKALNDNPLLQELRVTSCTNHGISLLMRGDSVGALWCFREAARHASSTMTDTNKAPPPWLLLPTYFNLSLLLLRDGQMEESAMTWLHARGHLSTWQNAVSGDNEALRKLKDARVMAINRHGLLVAKRGMQGNAPTKWDQDVIMEWVPPVSDRSDVREDSMRFGGVDAMQITALDVVLLRYAVSNAEKKASNSFRRSSGHMY